MAALAPVRQAGGLEQEARALCDEARSRLEGCTDPGRLVDILDQVEQGLARRRLEATRAEPAEALSARELEVLRLLPTELSEPDIGTELFISHHTVHSHTRTIYRKLGVSSRAQAVARARMLGLLEKASRSTERSPELALAGNHRPE